MAALEQDIQSTLV